MTGTGLVSLTPAFRDMTTPPLTPADFRQMTNVSRETMDRLDGYVRSLRRWNRTTNLVSAESLKDVWRRHILDCAQLAPLISEQAEVSLDIGSGAGLPGVILAILLQDRPTCHVVCVDSHTRKCAFLAAIAAELAIPFEVVKGRLEDIPPFQADIVTARALAPLGRLLDHAIRFAGPHTQCLFLKGHDVESELTAATEYWTMSVDLLPSVSHPQGQVVLIQDFRRVHSQRPF